MEGDCTCSMPKKIKFKNISKRRAVSAKERIGSAIRMLIYVTQFQSQSMARFMYLKKMGQSSNFLPVTKIRNSNNSLWNRNFPKREKSPHWKKAKIFIYSMEKIAAS